MSKPNFNYDETSDTLYISFSAGEKATGIELNESILLRIQKKERRAIGITIFNYSYLAQKTSAGLRSLPLTGLEELSPTLRELVLDLLMRPPVSEFLLVSTYTPSLTESIPITSLQQRSFASA
jgi:uncharacterized protein YuzE